MREYSKSALDHNTINSFAFLTTCNVLLVCTQDYLAQIKNKNVLQGSSLPHFETCDPLIRQDLLYIIGSTYDHKIYTHIFSVQLKTRVMTRSAFHFDFQPFSLALTIMRLCFTRLMALPALFTIFPALFPAFFRLFNCITFFSDLFRTN